MARATLELPSLLRAVIPHGAIAVDGATVDEALEDAYRQVPVLRVHLCDESGRFRQHVLCYLNDTNTRWLSPSEQRLRDGDCITILQAVSGG
jgi:molybdopterin converting factor small subunit